MATLLPEGKQSFTNSAGAPLVGGKVYTYDAGTNTPRPTYADAAGTVPNTNPVILDARGEATIFWNGTYKIVLKDASDVTIWTVDNVADTSQLPNALRADLADTSSVLKGDALIGVAQPTPRTQHSKNAESRSFEDFGAKGDGSDDSAYIQAALDWARANSRDVEGTGKYTIGTGLLIEQYRTTPAVSLDFNTYEVRINQLVYTGAGVAITANSPAASVRVKRLVGPGYGTTAEGLRVTGQGDAARHRVDWASGFLRAVRFYQAYSHTAEVGYVDGSNTGVLLEESNAIRLFGGRIGGQFSDGATTTDVTTCDIGVDIASGAANEIYATIEYCRHTANSVGLRDNGVGTYFHGYIEGCNAWNLQALGSFGTFDVLNGGNNNAYPAGFQTDGQHNHVRFLNQDGAIEETPAGNNTTLTFFKPTPQKVGGVSWFDSTDGLDTAFQGSGFYRNELANSSTLNSGNWAQGVIGAALWADVGVATGNNGYLWGGLLQSTRFVFPARAADNDIWRLSQSNRVVTQGPVNYGVFARVITGEVELMIRVLEPTNGKQTRTVMRLQPSSSFIRIGREYIKSTANSADAVFELSFRSRTGGTIDLMGAHLVNQPGVLIPPTNRAAALRIILPGKQVDGNMFPSGVIINGPWQLQLSPLINGPTNIIDIEYPVYLITGGWTGNITLFGAAEDGARVVFKRDGVAATGALNILAGAQIDGSGASISMQTTWSVLELVWSAGLNSWLKV